MLYILTNEDPGRMSAVAAEMLVHNIDYQFIKGCRNGSKIDDIHTDFYWILDQNLASEFFIYAEDDCQFTSGFSRQKLDKLISLGHSHRLDIISLGSFYVGELTKICADLVGAYCLMGCQLIIVFKTAYAELKKRQHLKGYFDVNLYGLNMACSIPFLSIQSGIRESEFLNEEKRLLKLAL